MSAANASPEDLIYDVTYVRMAEELYTLYLWS